MSRKLRRQTCRCLFELRRSCILSGEKLRCVLLVLCCWCCLFVCCVYPVCIGCTVRIVCTVCTLCFAWCGVHIQIGRTGVGASEIQTDATLKKKNAIRFLEKSHKIHIQPKKHNTHHTRYAPQHKHTTHT